MGPKRAVRPALGSRKTKEIGFDSIDIFADPLDLQPEERKQIKRDCDQAGLPIISVACVAVGPVDFNPSVQRLHVERVRAYLDMVREFEAKNLCSCWVNISGNVR